MKIKMFSIIAALVLSFYGCERAQNTNSDMQIIQMLKNFYSEYNAVWSTKPPLAIDVLERKLDSLNARYCTTKLRMEAKKSLQGDYGKDILTNDFPGIDGFDNLNIEKDINTENGYIVFYSHVFNDIPGKPSEHKVKLHVTVVKEGENYKIDSVR